MNKTEQKHTENPPQPELLTASHIDKKNPRGDILNLLCYT